MKYTIVCISDRMLENVEKNKKILISFDYVGEIEFCDGNKVDAREIIESMGIEIKWSPYDGRTFPPLLGELGLWVSNISIFQYIVKNNISKMLVIEDDAVLVEDFPEEMSSIMKEVPENFDFVSLYSIPDQNEEDEKTNLSLKYLHKTINQYASTTAMLYSFNGAKKILEMLEKDGMEYTVDCQLYKKSLEGKINGYSLKKEFKLVSHDFHIPSTIDPENLRKGKKF